VNPHTVSLERFVEAQEPVFDQVLIELAHGRKQTHWMWFVFPQFKGLGRSSMAEHFGIVSVDEAFQYLEHPVLGPRLEQCVRLVWEVPPGKSAYDIFGSLDYLKFTGRSAEAVATGSALPILATTTMGGLMHSPSCSNHSAIAPSWSPLRPRAAARLAKARGWRAACESRGARAFEERGRR